ncbi:MAG: carbohydrate kinase family protein [Actinomycetota bacterium]|nr:carbohydrate kinase family protein [Actinomycetota bacterium]
MTTKLVCTLGDLVEDVIVQTTVPLARGADVPALVSHHRGGSAANVAAVAARCGVPARFIGVVGADPVGHRLAADLEALGVDCPGPRRGRSGTVVVVVEPGGERTMFSDRRSAAEVDQCDEAWLDGVGALHVPYYSLQAEPLARVARALLAAARRRGIVVSLDPSSVTLIDARFAELVANLQPDLVLCNEDEAAALGVDGDGLPGATLVVVKRGPKPALLRGSVNASVPSAAVVAVDTTGAGDAFAGGFLAATVRGVDPIKAAEAGHAAAARVVRGRGADAWKS